MCYLEEAWEVYTGSKTLKEYTMKKDLFRYNCHLKDYWKDKPLENISNKDIIFYKKYLSDKKLSAQSVKHCLTLLRAIMNRAVHLEVYDGKVPHFEMPKIDNQRLRFLTKEEMTNLLNTLKQRSELWHDITLLALNTGMRASEIFGIRKTSINKAQKTLTILETKNSSVRVIPLNDIALEILEKYASQNLMFFFSNKQIKEVSSVFRNAVKASRINESVTDRRNKFVFHSLRHTFASWLTQEGVPNTVVGYLLGHKTPQMTLRYSHLAPNHGTDAVRIISNIIEN